MLQQKISPAQIFLLLAIIISVGAVLGFLSAIGKIGKINRPITNLPEKELCSATLLEDCDSKEVNVIGKIEYISKGPIPILTNIENREAEYTWAGGVFLVWPNGGIPNTLEGSNVKIVGTVSKGGQPCSLPGQPEQCLAPYHATQIKVEKFEVIQQNTADISITTDKTEYEQGENIDVSIKNNSNNQIKYFENIGCGAEIFANGEWKTVYNESSCEWGQELLLPAKEIKKADSAFTLEAGKYRLALPYKSEKLLNLKEIGSVKCDNIPADLESLLINGKWIKNEVILKDMCDACGCSATDRNIFSVGNASIDSTSVSCSGMNYTVNYKGDKFSCLSENYKNYIVQVHPFPAKTWEKTYSNEFTIKEKTAIDPRCGQKVKITGICHGKLIDDIGYQFNSETGKCIEKVIGGSGCTVEKPFNSLEECQKACETGLFADNELSFGTIEKGISSGTKERGNQVIKNKDDLIKLWLETGHGASRSTIDSFDFVSSMVIAVFQGVATTGGYNIEIAKIIETDNNIEVNIKETIPGSNCIVIQATTSPYHIIKVQKSDKEVVFKAEKIIHNCK